MYQYFTRLSSGTDIGAIYNGRFTFVEFLSEEVARDFLNGTLVDGWYKETLQHEQTHRDLFLRTRTGLMISGLRWFARYHGRYRKNYNFVYKYYLARTAFYRVMYDIHENNVDVISNGDFLKIDYSQQDKEVERQWADLGVSHILPFYIRWMSTALGWEYCRHFTVFTLERNGKTWRESAVTDSGFVNDRQEIRSQERSITTLVKRISKPLQIEQWSRNELFSDWYWLIKKMKAEAYYHLQYLGESRSTFEDYIHNIVAFAHRWSQVEDMTISIIVADELCKVMDGRSCEPEASWYEIEGFGKMINFFVLHGN